jgi:hypothetical protein
MRSYLDEVDFPAIQKRFDAFWQRQVLDRPVICIAAPRSKQKRPNFPTPDTPQERWLDIEYQLKSHELAMENTVYLGDAFPSYYPNIGPDSFTAFLGAELRFVDDSTSWAVPFVEDLREWEPALDPQNRWWRLIMDMMDAACEAARGRYVVGLPDLHGGGDALSAARHPDRLALDLYDKPREVKRLMRRMTEVYIEVCDAYFGKTSRVQEGSTTWLHAYSRGRYTALQNDFSGLSSPAMFREFFREDIARLADYLDNSIYHLDGPTALGNLDDLLSIEALDGIQWVQGAGAPPMSQWVDVCRRVLEAGKCLHIFCTPGEVEFLLSRLPHGGLCICTGCASEEEGRALLRKVESAARKRRRG